MNSSLREGGALRVERREDGGWWVCEDVYAAIVSILRQMPRDLLTADLDAIVKDARSRAATTVAQEEAHDE